MTTLGYYASVSTVTSGAAAGSAYAEIQPFVIVGSDSSSMGIVEIGFSLATATASSVGLIEAATQGTISAAGTHLGKSERVGLPLGVSVGNLGTAWTLAPTISGTPSFFRREERPAVLGDRIVWTWPQETPLKLANTGSLLLWNFGGGAGSALEIYVRWIEGVVLSQATILQPFSHS